VLIDGPPAEGAQPSRHGGQAPEVDSMTLVRGARYQPGELVEVRCTATRDYDLIAMPTRVLLPVLS
jgi:hypothetical protein